jgi:alkylation response protein AidB-like acyl-CoA dehydrogenase
MDFELSDDQRMLKETVASFARQSSPVHRARKLREDPVGWEPALWRQMAELGWLAVPFGEEVGGLGAGSVEVALIMEMLGTTLVPEPFLSSVVLAGGAIRLLGTVEQQRALLGPMLDGSATLALAYAERGTRHDVGRAATRAERRGAGWALTGEKVFVLDGHRAETLIVSATADAGLTLFAVPATAPGLARRPVTLIDGRRGAELTLDAVEVDDQARLGAPGAAGPVLERVMDHAAAAAVAEGVGICQTVLDMTVDYLKTREQFGVKIASFQALQHKAVDMFVETELLRSMMLCAANKVDAADEGERRRLVSAAKAQLTMSGQQVVRTAVQLFGGIGVTDEHDVGLYFKRIQALCALFGDEAHHLSRLARGFD